jgi:zinc finger HIT domain-containing protein 3
LDSSKELQELFIKYPRLQSQLEEINTATLPPIEGYGFGQGASKRGGKVEVWNSDRGLQKGVEALSKARNASGEDGSGVREFSRLVLKILSGEEGARAAEVIQREIAEENAKIIEQLLNNER